MNESEGVGGAGVRIVFRRFSYDAALIFASALRFSFFCFIQ